MRQQLLFVLALFVLSSCRFMGGEKIRGNGNIVSVQRNVGGFHSIDAGGAVELRIKQDAANAVKIETDENLQEYLDVFVDGNTLVIQTKKGYNLNPSEEIIVYASAPTFRNIGVSGASAVISEGALSGTDLEIDASGASEIMLNVEMQQVKANLSGASSLELKGKSDRFTTEASGSSKIRCLELTTEETTLDVSGATEAEVSANKKLTIEASGASNVNYRGNPNVNQNSSGASSVRKIS